MATTVKLKNDLKKLKEALDRKDTRAELKPKIKAQIERIEKELDAKKTGKKTTAASTVATTKVLLGKLQKFVQKNKKYGKYGSTSENNLKKDAVRTALRTGRRESQGLRSNQHGTKGSNKGNVYYEYRTNRLDVKQPKAKQTFPILADGGETKRDGKNGYVAFYKGKRIEVYADTMYEAQKKAAAIFKAKKSYDVNVVLAEVDGKQYVHSTAMAKGGKLSYVDIAKIWLEYEMNEDNNAHSENVVLLAKNFGSKDDIKKAEDILKKHDKQGHITYEQQQERQKISDKLYPILVAKAKEVEYIKESGGYMAGGGFVAYANGDYEEQVGKFYSLESAKKFAKANKWKYDSITFEDELGDNIVVEKTDNFKDIDMLFSNQMAKGGELTVGVYRVGTPIKIEKNLYEQKIVEIFEDGSLATASDYARKLTDFLGLKKYPMITKKQLEDLYKKDGGTMAMGGKLFYEQQGIGKAKYTVSYHDGEKKHKDGSDFYDTAIFKNKTDLDKFKNKLLSEGYKERHESGGMMAKGGRIYKDFRGKIDIESWGKHDLYEMYDNGLDLYADVNDYAVKLENDISKGYADEFREGLISVLKNGKINYGDKSSLTFAQGGAVEHGLKVGDFIHSVKGRMIMVQNGDEAFQINIETGERRKRMEQGGELDNILLDTSSGRFTDVGGTTFLDLDTSGIFKHGGMVHSKTHRKETK